MAGMDGRATAGRTGTRRVRRPLARMAAILGTAGMFWMTQPVMTPAQSYSFGSVEIEGNQRIDAATILGYAGLEGGAISAGELNDAYQRVVASGLFQDVTFQPRGNTLVIRVEEWPVIGRINIEGNRRLDDDALLELVQSQPRRVFDPALAEADAQRITDLYASQGRLSVEVDPRIIRRADNSVDLVFEVTEGRVVEVERLSFVGNRDFSDRRLRRVLETKQAGLLRTFIQRDTYDPARAEFDQQVLRDFYLSRGYIDFRILSVDTEFSRQRDATFITFNIQEGQSYDFGRTSVVSEVQGLDPARFRSLLRIRAGQTYTPILVSDAVARMEQLATEMGLDFVRVDPRVTRNQRAGTIDIAFTLVRGPRIFVERIDIEGNQTTLDRVIRRQFQIVEGDPFNPREIRAAAERIRALNYFSDVQVDTREGTGPDQVIVDVNVEEAPTGTLSFGGSYGLESGLALAIGFSERNFLGRGQTLRFDITSGTDTANTRLTFVEPSLYGRDLAFRFDAFYSTSDRDNADFSTRRIGVSPGFEFPISRSGRLALLYTIAEEEISNVDDESSPILKEEEGSFLTSSLGYRYTWDNRRSIVEPQTAVRLEFGQELAGLGGDTEYLKTTAQATAQRRVWNDDLTLRATVEGGYVHALDGETRVTDRFNLRSAQFRGFESRGIGPRDLAVENDDSLGGNAYAVARLDAEFPLGLPEEYGITGGAFLDIGSVWSLDDVDGGADGSDGQELVDDSAALRAAIGLSLFWDTPVGPLRFNFSKALVKEDYDEEQNFDLTISTRF